MAKKFYNSYSAAYRHEKWHISWLVENRSKIQEDMARLYNIVALRRARLQRDTNAFRIFQSLVGAAFSLWRAVFQTEAKSEPPVTLDNAQDFLSRVIRDNTVTYTDEKNAWSLSYYLDNASYRLVDVFRNRLPARFKTDKLTTYVDALENDQFSRMTTHRWLMADMALRISIGALEHILKLSSVEHFPRQAKRARPRTTDHKNA